ncbi:MAG: mechanosensitive ion channel [Oscillatoriales cyanobacterium RM2_1_1]|nr:mechanosensitive ion channel [Oscillatoriales cyanobacterium SM2_3_0]NJO46051.1 mechanosensitive ion channel [Oscillatoriales cyanobacterium RM2_1_1]
MASSLLLPRTLERTIIRFGSDSAQKNYQQVIKPDQDWISLILFVMLIDVGILIAPLPDWIHRLEIPLGLAIAISISWLGSRLFRRFFEVYLLNAILQSKRKINSELLIISKFVANTLIVLAVIFLFAQTHQINIIGLLASLGIGGLAIAFAAQKTLEQLLGGIVLYLDRPFAVDDYICLPDGTFGRVESIGLRSTKIRTSGKGSLVIVPNNVLTQTNIENLSSARKIISLINLTFYTSLSEEEKALVRQIILDGTQDIFGIDHRITQVEFKELLSDQYSSIVQAQVTFFILGSGEISMELRSQLLEIAKQNITQKMQDFGIEYDLEEKQIDVTSSVSV